MAKYLVDSTKQLLCMMLLTGMMLSYIKTVYKDKYKKLMLGSVIVGFVAAVIMTIMKINTNLIDTSFWNLCIFLTVSVAMILFWIFSALKKGKISGLLTAIMAAVIVALTLFYFVPPVLEYPHTILLTEGSIISTGFLTKIIGIIFGLILTYVAGVSVYKEMLHLDKDKSFLILTLGMAVNLIRQITSSISIMMTKRMIPSNHALFLVSKYTANYSNWFIYSAMLFAMVMTIILWIRSANVNEPYSNPAEHRKIRAKWRNIKRWNVTTAVCFVFAILIMTVVDYYANLEPELSPIEDAVIKDGAVYVPFEQVSDGHLHRFGYTTEDGVTIRFIVIQKPNSSSYGVGLDACDICGETGYYEKDGQVVCNLCDVVMNINTIGFKGGCNPIVIDYQIQNGYIIVPIEGLVEYESEFK